MIPEPWHSEHRPADEMLHLASEISGLVAQISLEHLPELFNRILQAARATARLTDGVVFLQDNVLQETHRLEKDGTTWRLTRCKVFEAAEPASGDLLTFPVSAGPRQLGALSILPRSGFLALSPEQEHL